MKERNALIIIAKYPEKGQVKTRLNGHLSFGKIVEIYTRLLEQTIHKLRSIKGIDTFIAYAPEDAEAYFGEFQLNLIPLPEGDLGLRMFHAFHKVFNEGYRNASLVGADIPDLNESIILHAFELLSDNDVVYGPAEDGGYYLVGMRTLIKEIFEGVPWSTDQTLRTSLDRAQKSGYRAGFTETLYDVDTIEDVKRAGLLSALSLKSSSG